MPEILSDPSTWSHPYTGVIKTRSGSYLAVYPSENNLGQFQEGYVGITEQDAAQLLKHIFGAQMQPTKPDNAAIQSLAWQLAFQNASGLKHAQEAIQGQPCTLSATESANANWESFADLAQKTLELTYALDFYRGWVGTKVSKTGVQKRVKEPKPFKSGLKVNTVKAVTVNPHTGKPAFSFEEDDSLVDCHVCSPCPSPHVTVAVTDNGQ